MIRLTSTRKQQETMKKLKFT